MTMNDEINLSEMGVPGYIWLKMKAEDTEQNRAIHDAFREMANVECKDDYTLALGKLLEYYEMDAKVQLLYHEIESLRSEFIEYKKAQEESSKTPVDDGGTF